MYGPPPDPHQVLAPVGFSEQPVPWIVTIVAGIVLAAWARPERRLLFVTGIVIALTAPFAWYLPTLVIGSFPTIDKAGSQLFYAQGVQWQLLNPDDPALKLIGVHVGHLWIVAAFDLVLSTFAAFNAEGMLNLVLSWWAAALLFERLGAERRAALLLAFPFGMGLHQLRDLNWYTIEKSALYVVPLYAWSLERLRGRADRTAALALPAAASFFAFFINIYLGILCALFGAFVLVAGDRRMREGALISALSPLPLLALQWRLMHGEGSLGSPELFLTERAALDTFSLWPPAWNRLEAWRALNLPALALAAWGARDRRNWPWLGLAAVTFVLALGPTGNPVYLLLFEVIPGFWRVAKPETFFQLSWLALLAVAARSLTALRLPDRALLATALLFALGWCLGVRLHPAYPPLTEPVTVRLAPTWSKALPAP